MQVRCALVKQGLAKLSLSRRDAEDALDLVQGCHAHVSTAAALRDLHKDLLSWVRGLHQVPLGQANFPALRQFWRTAAMRVTLTQPNQTSTWTTTETAAAAAAAGEWAMQRQCERVVQQVVDALPQLERLKHSLGSESLAALQFMLEDDDANHHHNNGSGHGNNNGELMRYFVGASATELDSDDESLAPSDGVSVGSLTGTVVPEC